MTINLLDETIDVMKHAKKKTTDIKYIGSSETNISLNSENAWLLFKRLADKKYDSNTSKYQVAHDLVIIFNDGSWLERVHDGKWEHWVYHQTPQKPKGKHKTIKNLFGKDQTLEQINNNA